MRVKIMIGLLALMLAGDVLLLHGRYSARVYDKAIVAEEAVLDQDWSTPLVD